MKSKKKRLFFFYRQRGSKQSSFLPTPSFMNRNFRELRVPLFFLVSRLSFVYFVILYYVLCISYLILYEFGLVWIHNGMVPTPHSLPNSGRSFPKNWGLDTLPADRPSYLRPRDPVPLNTVCTLRWIAEDATRHRSQCRRVSLCVYRACALASPN